jgi:hypothetical protein
MPLLRRQINLLNGHPINGKEKLSKVFDESGGFPGVIGCVNGTHVRITAPNVDEPSFVNRKGYHSLNVQATSDHEGMNGFF